MGWNPTTQILTTPATDADMQAAFSWYTTNMGDFFNKSLVYINKWQKKKPIRSNLSELTEAQYQAVNNGATGTAWGLSIPNSLTTKAAFLSGWQAAWVYQEPRGLGVNEWYRLMDYNGYCTKDRWGLNRADQNNSSQYTPFDGWIHANAETVGTGSQIEFFAYGKDPDDGEYGYLSPYDFVNALDTDLRLYYYYLGIAVIVGTDVYLYTSLMKFSESAYSWKDLDVVVTLPNYNYSGEIYAVPVLSNTQFSGIWTNQTMRVIPLDGHYLTLTYNNADVFNIAATPSLGPSSTSITLTITNNTASSVVVNDLALYLVSDSAFNDVDDIIDLVDNNWIRESLHSTIYSNGLICARYKNIKSSLPSTTIAAGSTVTVTTTFNYASDGYGTYDNYINIVVGTELSRDSYAKKTIWL